MSEDIEEKVLEQAKRLPSMNHEELKSFCADVRRVILQTVSSCGGHLSSNLGSVELTVALHRSFSFPKDKIIFDVGHQTYTHKLLSGRSLKGIGAFGGESRFCDSNESPFDPADAGHSSTSLSLAEGFAISRDLRGESFDVVAVIGDSSVANGLAFEALNHIGSLGNKVIVVLNDNDMSISRAKGALSRFFRRISGDRLYNKAKIRYRKSLSKTRFGGKVYRFSYFVKNQIKRAFVPVTLFDTLGFTYLGPFDGHDIKEMEKAFKKAKNTTKPTVVHVLTKKGKGYPLAEKDKDGSFHSVPPFDLDSGKERDSHSHEMSFPAFFGKKALLALKEKENTLLLSAAMMKGSHLEEAFSSFPTRCFDVGIAEEHALTLASSFAINGFHPIVSLYSTFLQRGYDELLHDCARKKIDMTLLIDRAGLPGKDGETHAGIYDVAFLKSIPGVSVYMPVDFKEASALFLASLEKGSGIFAIRYPNAYLPLPSEADGGEALDVSKGYEVYKEGKDARSSLLLCIGPKGKELAKRLSSSFDGAVYLVYKLFPLSEDLLSVMKGRKRLFVYDSTGTETGFAESLKAALFDHGLRLETRFFSVPSVFVPHGSIEEQENAFHLGLEEVAEEISKED